MAEDTLVQVLVELHLLDARAGLEYDIPEGARDSIFAHYSISEERFNETLAYYADRPNEYLLIYRQVLEAMNEEDAQMRDRLDAR